jgi:hypothetical protein
MPIFHKATCQAALIVGEALPGCYNRRGIEDGTFSIVIQ